MYELYSCGVGRCNSSPWSWFIFQCFQEQSVDRYHFSFATINEERWSWWYVLTVKNHRAAFGLLPLPEKSVLSELLCSEFTPTNTCEAVQMKLRLLGWYDVHAAASCLSVDLWCLDFSVIHKQIFPTTEVCANHTVQSLYRWIWQQHMNVVLSI